MQKTYLSAQKIDWFSSKTYSIVIIFFHIITKLNCLRVFQKMFWFADVSKKVLLNILFLILMIINIKFTKKKTDSKNLYYQENSFNHIQSLIYW